jgi:predicted nucleic acid-binding protein
VSVAVLDTTVIIHLLRKNQVAHAWLASQHVIFSITPITWMEVMVGTPNKSAQADSLNLLSGFEIIYLNQADEDWAMNQMLAHHFSQGVGVMDCFNASVCHRLNLPIYTHNQKDYLKILSSNLVIKPY